MKRILLTLKVAITTVLLALPMMAIGETPVKVFDLGIDNVYNIYIDSPVSSDGEPTFCFQTSDKLIKTDSQGKIIAETANPYRYFTVFNGDTLILKGYNVINAKGDTVAHAYGINGSYQYLAVSSSGVYVFQYMKYGTSNVMDFLSNDIRFMVSDLKGLCCSGGFIYGISKQSVETYPSLLYYRKENDPKISYSVPQVIKEPRGIAEYQNCLYIYSASDKALYKIEAPLPPNQTVTESSADSLHIGKDTIYYLERNRNFTNIVGAGLSSDIIDTVVLYSLTTDLYICKRVDVGKREIESLVRQYLPDANFKWGTGQYDYRCTVTTNSPGLDEALDALKESDAIDMVSKKYIRKDIKDLIDQYPFAAKVPVYLVSNNITLFYTDPDVLRQTDGLIKSLGLTLEYVDNSRDDIYKHATLSAPKTVDVISAAYKLQESGYFIFAAPHVNPSSTKKYQVQTIDLTGIQYYYGANQIYNDERDGSKQYLYPVPGSFAVRKAKGTERAQTESLIRANCTGYCKIEWLTEDYCFVRTAPEKVSQAMDSLLDADGIEWVSKRYLDNTFYVQCLEYCETMVYWGLDGRVLLDFNDDVPEAERDRLISTYNLTHVFTDTIPNSREQIIIPVYDLPKKADLISVCDSLYESGLVKYAVPNIIKERYNGIHHDIGSSITRKIESGLDVKKTVTQYYNLAGRLVDTPSGLTIVVTRYSDGSTKTEKLLFGK